MRQRLSGAARNLAALLSALLLGGGCTTADVYGPSRLLSIGDERVTVLLNDGRAIRFGEGDYRVLEADGGSIQGKGVLLTGRVDNSTIPWEGTIAFGEMKSVSTTRVSIVGIAGIALLGCLGIVAAMAFLFNAGSSQLKTSAVP